MAEVKVLIEGYTNADAKSNTGEEKTCSTVSLVIDKGIKMVVDPGVLDNQQILVDALKKEGLSPNDITIVCITHSHIDHYRNVGMFPKAKTLEYFGLWDGGKVEDWQENFTDNIQILKTPGHDYTGITLFVKTKSGVVAICGDVFWKENSPETDIYASDLKKLDQSRKLVLKMSHWIIPGHAGMYKTANGQRLQKVKTGQAATKEPLGTCKECKRPFKKSTDKCICQEWLCFRCCECETDCSTCNCEHKK